MSVLDRQQTTSDPTPPMRPSSGGPWVGILIACLILGMIALGAYLLWPAQAAPQTEPSPTIAIPSTYPDAPEARDIEAAKAAYMKYDEIDTRLDENGRVPDNLLEDLKTVTTGKAYGYEKAEAKADKKARYVFDGEAVAEIRSAKLGADGNVILRVCIDQSTRTAVDSNGKQVQLIKWIVSKVSMQKVGDTWKLADRDDEANEQPCV